MDYFDCQLPHSSLRVYYLNRNANTEEHRGAVTKDHKTYSNLPSGCSRRRVCSSRLGAIQDFIVTPIQVPAVNDDTARAAATVLHAAIGSYSNIVVYYSLELCQTCGLVA